MEWGVTETGCRFSLHIRYYETKGVRFERGVKEEVAHNFIFEKGFSGE